MLLRVLHSELTTHRQVTPKKIKTENKTLHPTRGSTQFVFQAFSARADELRRSAVIEDGYQHQYNKHQRFSFTLARRGYLLRWTDTLPRCVWRHIT
jgi:hypothetical protein